jgi:hypothetical protein
MAEAPCYSVTYYELIKRKKERKKCEHSIRKKIPKFKNEKEKIILRKENERKKQGKKYPWKYRLTLGNQCDFRMF